MGLSRFNFFNRLDARARIFFLIAAFVGFVLIIYVGARLISGGTKAAGPTRVATAPRGLVSVPGAVTTPEYQRAVEQANATRAQQATLKGTSALPTLVNYGGQVGTCVVCADQAPNVKNYLDQWTQQGKISPDVAADLQALADKNVSVPEYAARLAELVKQGKLTPEQARQLLDEYRKQHANNLLQESAKAMDDLIKSGQLPLDSATQLLNAQRDNISPSDYAGMLQQMVREGKITPEVAQRLLSQYTQQRAKEIIMRSIQALRDMAANGQITQDVLKDLIELEANMVPVDAFSAALAKYVSAGKMTPAVSTRILDEFKSQKAAIGPTQTVAQLLQQAEAAAYGEINDLLKAGRITQDVAAQLTSMIQKDVSLDTYRTAINQLVQQKKLPAELAQRKFADYQKVKKLRELAKRLAALQANNASPADYADALRSAVQDGAITPEEAARLLQEYQALAARAPTAAAAPGTAEFARLQQQVLQGAPATTPVPTAAEFAVPPTAAAPPAVQAPVPPEVLQAQQSRIQALQAAMSAQAGQLVASWQPPTMLHKGNEEATIKKEEVAKAGTAVVAGRTTTTTVVETGAPLVKAGTILFAILDTEANSDYPDSPVLATIVEGPFKGAKLLGKLTTAKGPAGQLDRIALNFTLMNMDQWPKAKRMTAYAIDPDTARSVMASSVNYHYLQRFGAIMATAFLQGYASAVTTSGSTSTTGIFGTSTSHPNLSPGQKLAVGLGQVGQTLGAAIQNYINIPPTVRIDAGVALGILYMDDVT